MGTTSRVFSLPREVKCSNDGESLGRGRVDGRTAVCVRSCAAREPLSFAPSRRAAVVVQEPLAPRVPSHDWDGTLCVRSVNAAGA